jgi:hypothetical protein
LRDKVEKRFKDINKYIKNNYSGEYRKWEEYSKLKDSLVEKWLRKANQSDKNWFERIEDISIVNQLTANTRSYIQYLYQTNKNNDNYIYDIKNSKAPKFWFFSSQFWGQVIRDAVTDSIREYIENDKLVDFYDDSNKFWLSQDALSTIENKIKSIQSLTPNFAKSVEKKWFTRDFFLPDENIYWCPVQDSFTKFYHITLNALIED